MSSASEPLSVPYPFICFDALWNALNKREPVPQRHTDQTTRRCLFVTWNMDHDLRGCIGTFSPIPLDRGLREYALISALQDTRFDPISFKEMPRLECEVSILQDFELCTDYLDWEVGTHGIYVEALPPSRTTAEFGYDGKVYDSIGEIPQWKTKHQVYSATFLPHVMPEQGWDQTQAVLQCIRKAGLSTKFTRDQLSTHVRVTRYKSNISEATFAEWKQSL